MCAGVGGKSIGVSEFFQHWDWSIYHFQQFEFSHQSAHLDTVKNIFPIPRTTVCFQTVLRLTLSDFNCLSVNCTRHGDWWRATSDTQNKPLRTISEFWKRVSVVGKISLRKGPSLSSLSLALERKIGQGFPRGVKRSLVCEVRSQVGKVCHPVYRSTTIFC